MKDERRLLQPAHVQSLLAHIDAEEVALRYVRRLLEEMPSDVADTGRHRVFRQQVDEAMRSAARLAQERATVLTHTARVCGIRPDQLTLSSLIRRSSLKAVPSLTAAQSRLQRLVRQIQSLAGVVGWVINESRTIDSIILQEILGDGASDRYTSGGQRSLDPSVIRFETRS